MSEDTRSALFLAIERLKAGKPNHPALRQAAADGRLRITVTNVAKESGFSRTLFGYSDCPYPEVRAAILASHAPSTSDRETLKEEVARLRHEVAVLEDKLVARDTAYAELVVRARAYERGILSDGRPIKPAPKKERQAAFTIVGKTPDSAKA